MTIIDQIKQIVKITFRSERMYSELCKVVSVNEAERTCVCQPIDDSAELQKVRLQSVKEQTTGLLIAPTVGSFVTVSFLDNRNGFISNTTGVDKILIDTDLVQFNGGTLDGMVKINDLVTKLNNLENKVNDLITYTASHTHTGVTTGAGTSGTSATPVTGSLTPTVKNDLENTKITQ